MTQDEKTITMMALGRPFGLGMLYDYRLDKLIPAVTLWDSDVLKTNLTTISQPFTNYTIHTENTLNDKVNLLGVEGSLKLSVLSGLVDVSGSAKYMHDRKMTKHQERVTLKYSTTLRFEQLSMSHLDKKKMTYTEVLDQDIATHVVTGIVYGADAFFIFNRESSQNEDSTIVHNKMEVLLNKIPKIGMSTGAEFTLNDDEKKTAESLQCTFYGDFSLQENPSTFEQALKLYKDLPNRLGQNGEKAVPKTIYLYPLRLLNKSEMKIVCEIRNDLIEKCVSFIDDLNELKMQANDLINDDFPAIQRNKEHVKVFIEYLDEFENDAKQKIMELIPKIRDNSVPQSQLSNLLKELGSSPFKKQTLLDWINLKRREITIQENLIRLIMKEKTVNVSPNSLDNALSDLECDLVFCLSFYLTEKKDSNLESWRHYLDDKTIIKFEESSESWWADKREMMRSSREKAIFFLQLAQANVSNRKIKFVIDDRYIDKDKKLEGILLNIYQNSIEIDMEIPSKPDKPYATQIDDDRILLAWTKSQRGKNSIQQYKIVYKQEDDEEWKSIPINTTDSQWQLIENLCPNTKYIFKVQAITTISITIESDISEPVITKISVIPNIPYNARWTRSGVTVAGGHGKGDAPNQLTQPWGLFVDADQTLIIADYDNQRVVQWKSGDSQGQVVAGGNGRGKQLNQLAYPTDVVLDKETDSLFISDRDNRRVVRWTRRTGTVQGDILLSNIHCYGLALDNQGFLYISDTDEHQVKRYRIGDKSATIVAGGHGSGAALHQLNYPTFIFVDRHQSIYISDEDNHRVMKWSKDATEGIVVAGGQGQGSSLIQLSHPRGLFVDIPGTLYVSDSGNQRIMRWLKGEKQGTIIAGGNGEGKQANQFFRPMDISFDRYGQLYVADWNNHRVQRFSIEKTA